VFAPCRLMFNVQGYLHEYVKAQAAAKAREPTQ